MKNNKQNNKYLHILYIVFAIVSIVISSIMGFLFVPFILDFVQYKVFVFYLIICIILFLFNFLFLKKLKSNRIFSFFISFFTTFLPFVIVSLLFSKSLSFNNIQNQNNLHETNIKINLMTNLNNKTQDKILKERIRYVAKSKIYKNNYSPNQELWLNIKDNIYWENIFSKTCKNSDWKNDFYKKGWSNESLFINNPAMLIGISFAKKYEATKYLRCDSSVIWCVPCQITYNSKEKSITAYYSGLQTVDNTFLKINTLNAQDFGYKYVTMYSKAKIIYQNKNNLSNNILEMNSKFYQDYTDKFYENGVNKISEYPIEYQFMPNLSNNSSKNKEIIFKLWKEKPENIEAKPDFTYKIIFLDCDKEILYRIIEADIVKGIYYKLLNNIKPNSIDYKTEKY